MTVGDVGSNNLERFCAMVLGDVSLQEALQSPDDLDTFVPIAIALAEGRGIRLEAEALRRALAYEPIGLAARAGGTLTNECPQSAWLPIDVRRHDGELRVEWAYFGKRSPIEPFFEDSVRKALRRPINRLARHRTRLADLARFAEIRSGLQPSGFIFHMSRCGSTLVSQMLASDRRNRVVSEASPLDAIVMNCAQFSQEIANEHVVLLTAMIQALGASHAGQHSRYFIKLDSWHSLALPLFRIAFPSIPWVFLYREPSEVLASQMLERGIQTVPEFLPPAFFDLKHEDRLPSAAYCARVLNKTCEAALEHYQKGGGLLINYRQLPAATWTQILPHFGIEVSRQDQERMAITAQFDAKTPSLSFSADEKFKRNIMTDELCTIADLHIGKVYRALEAQRLASR